ncbi:MAG: DUF4382 domain-containing protein [Chitinophagaceae bacterium]
MKKLRLSVAIPAIGLVSLLLILFVNFSCQKEKNSSEPVPEGQQRVKIRLSDNPVSFDAVNVDIQRVEVFVVPDSCRKSGNDDDSDRTCHHDRDGDRDRDHDDCGAWDTLDIKAGIYNLLDLSNGADTLLASGFTIAGKIKKIRLTLGTENSVVIDSVSYPLDSWNDFNRVTINVRGEDVDQINPSDLQLWLDFDAGRSIVKIRNNHFVLKPFLRIWLPAQTASIKGKISPSDAGAVVSAIADGDTLVAIPHGNGWFKIRGLRGSTADVFINATANGYQDTTLTAVSLVKGKETDIGTVELHK